MDLSEIALTISCLSMLGTTVTAIYTARAYRLARQAAKRPAVIVEPEWTGPPDAEGWRHWQARLANPSFATARITRFRAPWRCRLRVGTHGGTDIYGNPDPSAQESAARVLRHDLRLLPFGQFKPAILGDVDGSEIWIHLLVRGTDNPKRIKVDWHWVDGTAR